MSSYFAPNRQTVCLSLRAHADRCSFSTSVLQHGRLEGWLWPDLIHFRAAGTIEMHLHCSAAVKCKRQQRPSTRAPISGVIYYVERERKTRKANFLYCIYFKILLHCVISLLPNIQHYSTSIFPGSTWISSSIIRSGAHHFHRSFGIRLDRCKSRDRYTNLIFTYMLSCLFICCVGVRGEELHGVQKNVDLDVGFGQHLLEM